MSDSTSISALINRYFSRHHFANELEPLEVDTNCKVIIVVPAYMEDPEYLLQSLELCDLKNPDRITLLWLINQSEADSESVRKYHLKQAEELQSRRLQNGLRLVSRAILNLLEKQAGVGLARKVGMDLALAAFSEIDFDGLIVCLDGDCKVSNNYLKKLLEAEEQGINGASLYFEHPLDGLKEDEKGAIIHYEIWLRYYAQALEKSGVPWNQHTIGSSMAVRCSSYARIGGMNRRKAGEDFYFLHKLMPQGKFVSLNGLKVFPQARVSNRVPFGTGRAMQEIKTGNKSFEEIYNPLIFKELNKIIGSIKSGQSELLINQEWRGFLSVHSKIDQSFQALLKRTNAQSFNKQFLLWFDGFKVLKYVHYRQGVLEDLAMQEAVNQLFGIKGNAEEILMQLRRRDALRA